MHSMLKLKHLITTLFFVIVSNPLLAHEIKFIKDQSSTEQPQDLIKRTLEKSCRSIYNSPLHLNEVLSRIYCEYENKWCWNNGFSILDTTEGQTLIIQYSDDSGTFKITKILLNSNEIVCDLNY